MSTKVLLVDDDPAFSEELVVFLEGHGLDCHALADPAGVLALLDELRPNLLLLDQRLGAVNGMDVLRAVRQRSDVPCVMLTGVTDPIDRILGLELGADDYVNKTALPREVLARIRAVLRRAQPAQDPPPAPAGRTAGAAWDLRAAERELYRPDGARCHLTSAEFNLLNALVTAGAEPQSREALTELVFNRPYRPGDRAIDTLVVRLRRKLEPDPEHPVAIISARQQGYLFAGFPPVPP
jgi:DNA-binding response OmpR family regulator